MPAINLAPRRLGLVAPPVTANAGPAHGVSGRALGTKTLDM